MSLFIFLKEKTLCSVQPFFFFFFFFLKILRILIGSYFWRKKLQGKNRNSFNYFGEFFHLKISAEYRLELYVHAQ